MEIYELHNENLQVQTSTHGGELLSLKRDNHEYLWQANSNYWARHAPILFPNVGKLWNDEYRVKGKIYHSKQHGFARDTEFTLIHHTDTSLQLECINHGANESFPYRFKLTVLYTLLFNELHIKWNVLNIDTQTIYFQIGAHPGFNYLDYHSTDSIHGYLQFYDSNNQPLSQLQATHVNGGYQDPSLNETLALQQSLLPLTNNTFVNDAIIFEHSQVRRIVLLDKHANPYLRVSSPQAEAYGIWSPNKEGAPFMCIEPWCGRADSIGFTNDISLREYIHSLAPQSHFSFEYIITLL